MKKKSNKSFKKSGKLEWKIYPTGIYKLPRNKGALIHNERQSYDNIK